MLLRATAPKDAHDERELRAWLINEIGEADQLALVDWVYENHRGAGETYVGALGLIVRQTAQHGREFLNRLLEVAKKPKEVRQAETEILFWWRPRAAAAVAKVREHGATQEVAAHVFEELCEGLQEKLRNMFPDKHRAAMKGAMLVAFTHTGGAFTLDVSALVKALFMEDPLAVNARASWG